MNDEKGNTNHSLETMQGFQESLQPLTFQEKKDLKCRIMHTIETMSQQP